MSQSEVITRWLDGAKRNLETARDLVKTGHYDWALFVGQLAIEKLLKSLVIAKTNESPPLVHDLVKLADIADIELSDQQRNDLVTITRFHIQARYDDVKYELYKTATKEYTKD